MQTYIYFYMTTKQRRWFSRLEISLWVLVAGALLYHFTPAAPLKPVTEGEVAPPFSVHAFSGQKVDLDDLRGKVVLVNFWATWCPPCRLEMPGFESVFEDYRNRGFTVVGLSADLTGEAGVREFVRERGITYPVAMASEEVRRRYGGVDMLPQSFLLDRRGRVRKMVSGVFSESVLRRSVEELLTEKEGT